MTSLSIAGHAQLREHCHELVASLGLQAPCQNDAVSAALGRRLGTKVNLAMLPLPANCPSLWLGFTGADRIVSNVTWRGNEITLAGHAIGHLVLGHCGEPRDGAQFACTAGHLGKEGRRWIGRLLHDPDGGLSRVFSDREEHAAEVFAEVFAEVMGISRRPLAADCPAAAFTCVG